MQWFLSRPKAAARLLDDSGYVAARRFTMADISVAYALKLGQQLGFADSFPEPFKAHLERMKARPAYAAPWPPRAPENPSCRAPIASPSSSASARRWTAPRDLSRRPWSPWP